MFPGNVFLPESAHYLMRPDIKQWNRYAIQENGQKFALPGPVLAPESADFLMRPDRKQRDR